MNSAGSFLVRGPNWLGDAVMSLPALTLLLRSRIGAEVGVLTRASISALYRYVPGVARIHSLPATRGWRELLDECRLASQLRALNYRNCLVFPNSLHAALIPWMARIPERTGFSGNLRGCLLTSPVSRPADFFQTHHSRHYLDIVRAAGITSEGTDAESGSPCLLKVPVTEQERMRDRLQSACRDSDVSRWVAFCPGAAFGPAKKWFAERYRLLAQRILDSSDLGLLILGTEEDQEQGRELSALGKRVLDWTGQTGLEELISVLGVVAGLVTNDSGAMHLSGALGTPVAAIFGSTSPLATRGLGPVHVLYEKVFCSPCFLRTCPGRGMICMEAVTVDQVWKVIEPWLHPPSSS